MFLLVHCIYMYMRIYTTYVHLYNYVCVCRYMCVCVYISFESFFCILTYILLIHCQIVKVKNIVHYQACLLCKHMWCQPAKKQNEHFFQKFRFRFTRESWNDVSSLLVIAGWLWTIQLVSCISVLVCPACALVL